MAILPNPLRKESTLTLGGKAYTCRPTLDKIQRIENRFGAAVTLMNRVAAGNVTQMEMAALVTVMLLGIRDAPKQPAIADLVFETGIISLAGQVSDFLANGISSDLTPPAPVDEGESEPPLGNA